MHRRFAEMIQKEYSQKTFKDKKQCQRYIESFYNRFGWKPSIYTEVIWKYTNTKKPFIPTEKIIRYIFVIPKQLENYGRMWGRLNEKQ